MFLKSMSKCLACLTNVGLVAIWKFGNMEIMLHVNDLSHNYMSTHLDAISVAMAYQPCGKRCIRANMQAERMIIVHSIFTFM